MSVNACSIEGCDRPFKARGWCNLHWYRWYRSGDPQVDRAPTRELSTTKRGAPKEWLEAHLRRSDWSECETLLIDNPWPFARDHGYPIIRLNNRKEYVHRIVCSHFNGPPSSAGPVVRHLCGNGYLGCLRPACLAWGSYAENSADMVRHGRSGRGGLGSITRILDENQVVRIVELYRQGCFTQSALATQFGVSQSTISKALLREKDRQSGPTHP